MKNQTAGVQKKSERGAISENQVLVRGGRLHSGKQIPPQCYNRFFPTKVVKNVLLEYPMTNRIGINR